MAFWELIKNFYDNCSLPLNIPIKVGMKSFYSKKLLEFFDNMHESSRMALHKNWELVPYGL